MGSKLVVLPQGFAVPRSKRAQKIARRQWQRVNALRPQIPPREFVHFAAQAKAQNQALPVTALLRQCRAYLANNKQK
jgi:hypothetical protein